MMFALFALLSEPAHAGYSWPVEVNVSSTTANGSLAAARDSSDSTQYILCATYTYGTTVIGVCQARDSSGDLLSCSTTDPEMLEVIEDLDPYGYVYFQADSGSCSYVYTNTSSYYLP